MKLGLKFAVAAWSFFVLVGERNLQAEPAKQNNVGCIVEIQIPDYSVARLALKTGTVEAVITVGKRGVIAGLKTNAPDPRLAQEVVLWLKKSASFDPSCEGREVLLYFTFRLEGEATHYPFHRVRFRAPNHFIIISQPRLPIIDYGPP